MGVQGLEGWEKGWAKAGVEPGRGLGWSGDTVVLATVGATENQFGQRSGDAASLGKVGARLQPRAV